MTVLTIPSLIFGYIQSFKGDDIGKKTVMGLQSQVRPDIGLKQVEETDLADAGPTVMGIFVNSRNNAHDFKWAAIAGDGKTEIPFDLPPFKDASIGFGSDKSQELPLFKVSDYAKVLPAAYKDRKLLGVYTLQGMSDEISRPGNADYIPVVITYSYKSDMDEQLSGKQVLYLSLAVN